MCKTEGERMLHVFVCYISDNESRMIGKLTNAVTPSVKVVFNTKSRTCLNILLFSHHQCTIYIWKSKKSGDLPGVDVSK